MASLIEELQRVTCETVEQIAEWRTEKDKEANNTEKGETTSGAEKDSKSLRPFIWNRTNYMIKMGVDLKFLEPHRAVVCAGHEAVLPPCASRQQAMQLDTSENNPLEMLSTEMLMSLTRRIDDFPAFFDKHDESGDGKLQRGEFASVIRDMGLSLTKEQMTELYFVLDRDGDGEIDTKELLRALTDTRRAAQIGWMRFEEVEAAILNELSLVATPRGQVNGLSQMPAEPRRWGQCPKQSQ